MYKNGQHGMNINIEVFCIIFILNLQNALKIFCNPSGFYTYSIFRFDTKFSVK